MKILIEHEIKISQEHPLYCDERCDYYKNDLIYIYCNLFQVILKASILGDTIRCSSCKIAKVVL